MDVVAVANAKCPRVRGVVSLARAVCVLHVQMLMGWMHACLVILTILHLLAAGVYWMETQRKRTENSASENDRCSS
jgi:cyanate permease